MAITGSIVCFVVAAIIAIGLIIWGFIEIFKAQQVGESDVQVLQRQLKGFAFLILASIVWVALGAICGMGALAVPLI